MTTENVQESQPIKQYPCRYCGEQECPRRHNVERQEAVVSALWEFAANLQLRPDVGCIATIASGQEDAGTRCSLDHVDKALRSIMAAFNYGVVPIQ